MSLPTAILPYGGSSLVLLAESIRENAFALDTGNIEFLSGDEFALATGQACPNRAGLYIRDINKRRSGVRWHLTCDVEGINGAKTERHLPGSPVEKTSAVDWDTVNIEKITTGRPYTAGVLYPFGMAMACTDVSYKPLDDHGTWSICSASIKGIKNFKPAARTITSGGRTISGDNITWSLDPGWTTARAGEVQLSEVTVTDVTFSTSPPDTAAVPGNRVPPNTPGLRQFNVSITDGRQFWPNGWVYTVAGEQLLNYTVWKITETYRWQYRVLPK